MSNNSPRDHEDSAECFEHLPEMAERAATLLEDAAREALEIEALAERVLDLPASEVSDEERAAARAAIDALEPFTGTRGLDARYEPPREPTVPEELLPDGEAVLGELEGGDRDDE